MKHGPISVKQGKIGKRLVHPFCVGAQELCCACRNADGEIPCCARVAGNCSGPHGTMMASIMLPARRGGNLHMRKNS